MPFSEERAHRAEIFFERVLIHSKGAWAGQPFTLLPWERDRVIRPLFGTLNPDGTRQYRTCFVFVPRKAGKSTLAAGVALYLLIADGEPGARVYGAAGDREQAGIVHEEASQMVRHSIALSSRLKPIDSTKRIVDHKTGSFYRAVPSEAAGAHGYNASGIIVDELHVQPNRNLWDVLTTSTGARRQPLTFAMTTAGFDRTSICWEIYDYASKVQRGIVIDPTFLPVMFEADPEDAWDEPKTWYKANPSLGQTVQESFYQAEAQRAKEIPAYQNTFKRLYLNLWTSQDTRWLDMSRWDDCNLAPIDLEALKGRTCYAGLDLASSVDIAALCLVFPRSAEEANVDENGDEAKETILLLPDEYRDLGPADEIAPFEPSDKAPEEEISSEDAGAEIATYRAPPATVYDVVPFFWVPGANVEARVRRDRVPYDTWIEQGLITATEGDVIDYATIEKKIVDLSQEYNLIDLGFDRWGATQISQNLTNEGIEVVPIGQGYRSLSPPTKELLRLVIGKKLNHGGDAVLRWMADNVRVTTDAAANVKPDKAKSTQRIDGIVALLMALDRAIRNGETRSVYEDRGLLVI